MCKFMSVELASISKVLAGINWARSEQSHICRTRKLAKCACGGQTHESLLMEARIDNDVQSLRGAVAVAAAVVAAVAAAVAAAAFAGALV